ncbi:hypothetical protein [Lewinella sp. JB7]|uniref:hypothetical protein n=1 Tax=Lewinella sp. JB7 TaxID=2962887 RepID=UPI0020C94F31|nr:hypothetical protein [Lewinella sp. JB7]MCP9237175.1 hypothetical protein [Lewinella sp. JB7]
MNVAEMIAQLESVRSFILAHPDCEPDSALADQVTTLDRVLLSLLNMDRLLAGYRRLQAALDKLEEE